MKVFPDIAGEPISDGNRLWLMLNIVVLIAFKIFDKKACLFQFNIKVP